MKFNHIYKNVEVFREREEKDKTEGKLKWTFKGEKKRLELWATGIGRVETHHCGFCFPRQAAKSSVR